ncbi:MAG: hypothetical protein AAF494_05125 [Pseudomonadota bacterium]
MMGQVLAALALTGVLSAPVGASVPQIADSEPVTVTSGPRWEVAYLTQYTRQVQCQRSGTNGTLSFVLDNEKTTAVFYAVSAISIAGASVSEAILADVNQGIAQFAQMPDVSLQCAGDDLRIALVGEGRADGREIIVPLDAAQ